MEGHCPGEGELAHLRERCQLRLKFLTSGISFSFIASCRIGNERISGGGKSKFRLILWRC